MSEQNSDQLREDAVWAEDFAGTGCPRCFQPREMIDVATSGPKPETQGREREEGE